MVGGVPTKVRVFGLKRLFLKRFTVRSTTRTLIINKNDHSAFTAILSDLISILCDLKSYEDTSPS
jgi:hypothetical protein